MNLYLQDDYLRSVTKFIKHLEVASGLFQLLVDIDESYHLLNVLNEEEIKLKNEETECVCVLDLRVIHNMEFHFLLYGIVVKSDVKIQ